MKTHLITLLYISYIFYGSNRVALAQIYLPGQTYLDQHGYIEYSAGHLPVIIAAPHGGYLQPDSMPDRFCPGCTYVNDAFTQELARQIDTAFATAYSGCKPHLVINLLDRKKLDANRDLEEASDGHALAEDAWNAFHQFIESASESIENHFGKGIFIDLHGHGHAIQRLELGYLLYADELSEPDSILNSSTFLSYSSIRNLALSNVSGSSHADLLHGEFALGSLLDQLVYPSVPSEADPFPDSGEPYFSGGYNTNQHGSRFSGNIDAVQIECNMDGVRDTYNHRKAFAEALVSGLQSFLLTHYGIEPVSGCSTSVSIPQQPSIPFSFYQSGEQQFILVYHGPPALMRVYNTSGQVMAFRDVIEGNNTFHVPLPAGIYLVQLQGYSQKIRVQ